MSSANEQRWQKIEELENRARQNRRKASECFEISTMILNRPSTDDAANMIRDELSNIAADTGVAFRSQAQSYESRASVLRAHSDK